ncbi:MAG: ATP-dependent RecD-like DNA helicase [Gammaproteobacteria bacterium]|nr:ATP-dependent RecD-like DNA helicase [Gammaproteobacteria bacterium]MCW9030574.1 ATP-dependent RecD-like DNA helicase [Gammaproteobacteria bacterium]
MNNHAINSFGMIDKIISKKGGGVIFLWINPDKNIPQAVKVPYNILPCLPVRGEIWHVSGNIYDSKWGEQILASEITRGLPSGDTFQINLANNPKYAGISKGRSKRLWNTFGEDIFSVLDDNNVDLIVTKTNIPRLVIENLCETWAKYKCETEVVKWLHDYKIPTRLSFKIIDYYGEDAIDLLTENPFRLLAFTNWRTADNAAKLLGVADNDKRRLIAAVEAKLYEIWGKKGHTTIKHKSLCNEIKRKLKPCINFNADQIINDAINANIIIEIRKNMYQHLGANALEAYIKDFIGNTAFTLELFRKFDIKRLRNFEKNKSIESGKSFQLATEQVDAVKTVLNNSFACITGGAGVGKTTILEAIYDQINEPESIIQCALTGRAQRRMTEATGYPAMTIACLLNKAESNSINEGSIIVIDESSMLDVTLFVKLLRTLPSTIYLYLIGDAHQLPPIGPGLVFHLCVKSKTIPVVELTQIHRASETTGIPQASQMIRNQKIPKLDNFIGLKNKDVGLSFIETNNDELQQNEILSCYREMIENGEVQILAYRNSLSDKINITLHNEKIECMRSNNIIPHITGGRYPIAEKEPIIWLNINDYNRNLYNGSMGTLVEVFGNPIIEITEEGNEVEYIASADFDSSGLVMLTEDDFSNIKLSYSVTCHKAQGSQWERVIVAIEDAKNIDNSWIYTAVTRTQKQAVCIGDFSIFKRIVCSEPSAFSRCVGLEL